MRKIRLASDNPYDDNYVDSRRHSRRTVNPFGMVPFFENLLGRQMNLKPDSYSGWYDSRKYDYTGMSMTFDLKEIPYTDYMTKGRLKESFERALDEKGWSKYYTLIDVLMGETGMVNPPYIIKFVFDMKPGYQTVRYGRTMARHETDVYIGKEEKEESVVKPKKDKKVLPLPKGSKIDPRSLEDDFESDHSVNLEEMLSFLKKVADKKFYARVADRINSYWWEIWFQIDDKVGINLREREKLVPHFKEMGRIFGVPSLRVAYRGLSLPSFAGNYLTETYPYAQDGDVIIPQDRNVIKILTGLSYGVRSWTNDRTQAIRWSLGQVGIHKGQNSKDKVVLVYQKPKVLFDASTFMEAQTDDEIERWDLQNRVPFDGDEKIIYINNPVVQEIQKRKGIWFVLIANGHKVLPYNPKTPDVIKNFG